MANEYTTSQRDSAWRIDFSVEGVLVASLAIFGPLIVAAALLTSGGNVLATAAVAATLFIVVLSCCRLDWGFFFFIGMVLLFDQYEIPGFDSWTFKPLYFLNIKEISYLPHWENAVANPLELQLALLILVWLVLAGLKGEARIRSISVWGSALLFFLALACSFAYGLWRGGDFLPALWEVRALMYLGLLYVLVPQIIQTREQAHTLLWVCIGAISFKAFQGIVRFAELGFSFAGSMTVTNHEDPVFILDLLIFLLALVIFDARTNQRVALMVLLLPLLFGFFTGQRRSAYAAIVPALAAFVAVIPKSGRRMLLRTVVPVLGVLALYCGIFWESDSKFASPVKLVKTGMSVAPEAAGERYYSNLYRELEKFDLATTVQHHPVAGIGFGNKYEMPLPLAKIDFTLRDYISHNEILWLLVKMGAVGFCFFWLFMDSFVFKASWTLARLNDPYLKAIAAVSVAAVVNQMIVSNYDLQLTFYRNMIFLGTLMGLLSALEPIDLRDGGKGAQHNFGETPA